MHRCQEISTAILQDFWRKVSLEYTFNGGRANNRRPSRYQRDETLAMIQNELDRVMNLPAEEEEITTKANDIDEQIIDLFLRC